MKNISRNSRTSHKKLIREALYNVVRLEANINYTLFVMQTGKNKIMSYTLGMYGHLLCDSFLRVNRSCIINKNFVRFFDKVNKQLVLRDGTSVKISRRRWEHVHNRIAI
jgi:DNA-binding LytR/AlgR family response regulator